MPSASYARNRFRAPLLPPIASLLLLLVPFCSGTAPSDRCNQTFDLGLELHRRFVLSENAPTATILRSRADLKERIDPITNLLRRIVKVIDFRRQHHHIKQCNLEEDQSGWVYTAHLASTNLRIGKLSDRCYSKLDDNDALSSTLLPQSVIDNSMHVIGDGVQALYEALSNITESPQTQRFTNWSNTFPLRNWEIGNDVEICKIETFSAYRIGDTFFLRASMTNHLASKYVENWNRQFVSEWVRHDYSQSLKMKHPMVEEKNMVCGTTILEQWDGRAWTSWHGEMKDDDNPAVLRSSKQNKIKLDLAEDSIAAANIAITLLPMVMNFIPLALIAEFNTIGSLLYIIFTDIISAVPFLIKGIELISTTQPHPAVVAYYAGDEELADIQVWAADCSGTDRFRVIGWTFVAVAVFAAVLGILLEFIATLYMERKRKENEVFAVGPFGKVMLSQTGESVLGADFGLHKDYSSDYTSDTMEIAGKNAKDADGSQEAKQSMRESILKWMWIPSPSSPRGALLGSLGSEAVSEGQPGVGLDGLASSERLYMYHDDEDK